MKLTVLLGASQEASFDITLNDNSFTRKWIKELRWCLDHCDFNQEEAFASFLTLEKSAEILIKSCNTINRYLKNFIEIRSNILEQPQEYFNYLHRIFETLSGDFENPTRLVLLADAELKSAIRTLNFFVHRIETKAENATGLYISFDKNHYRRQSLDFDDYNFCQFKYPKGTLFLHYAELGKEFIDLYEDNLPIDYPGFKNLHYYSGEASISFAEYDPFEDKNYIKWLQDQGIDPYNKILGHGKIPLGILDDLEDAISKINNYRHIDSILIKE
jgi:hypothetical protein